MFQAVAAAPSSALELVLTSSGETKAVLILTAVLSVASWFIIGLKSWQFRRIHAQSRKFFAEIERAPRLQEAYRAVMKQAPSPFNRLFREGISFYTELRPGSLGGESTVGAGLSPTQLEALKMVLAKEVSAERDEASHYVSWLATVGSVGPLLGLLGTVLGVMDAFLGISRGGSGNLAAVAPGVAEALVTTVAGLATAIPALMAYNHFANRVGRFEGELEGFGNELVGWMAREGLL